jgi:transposase
MRRNRPPASEASAGKADALRRSGTLNSRADTVQDSLFRGDRFFDPLDLPQVKYEMLRQVRNEAKPITRVAATFGLSRPAFYKAQQDFEREGMAGLLPRRRGPKRRHKLTPQILDFAEQVRARDSSVSTVDLVQRIQATYGVQVHRRSVERAMAAAKKNGRLRRRLPNHGTFSTRRTSRAVRATARLCPGARCPVGLVPRPRCDGRAGDGGVDGSGERTRVGWVILRGTAPIARPRPEYPAVDAA